MSIRLYIGTCRRPLMNRSWQLCSSRSVKGFASKLFWIVKPAPAGDSFANVDDEKVADALIEQLNGRISVAATSALNAPSAVKVVATVAVEPTPAAAPGVAKP